jgi:hypothetical protein
MSNTPNRSNTRRYLLLGCTAVLLLCALGVGASIFTACTSNKYIAAAGLPPPDSGFQTGTIYGYDVWLWDCFQNQHIAVYRYSAEMTAGLYERQQVPCGELTPIELQVANEEKRSRDPANFW